MSGPLPYVAKVNGLRLAIGLVIAAIAGVSLVPMVVLVDLAGGGDGLGLCPGGIGSCRTSYFTGPELLGILMVVLFLLFMLLRALLRLAGSRDRGLRTPPGTG